MNTGDYALHRTFNPKVVGSIPTGGMRRAPEDAGLYLLGMDMLYDLEHRIYASNSGGVIEILIDILVAVASVGVLWWSWRNRWRLLNPADGRWFSMTRWPTSGRRHTCGRMRAARSGGHSRCDRCHSETA
jgi:hypothetical protein